MKKETINITKKTADFFDKVMDSKRARQKEIHRRIIEGDIKVAR